MFKGIASAMVMLLTLNFASASVITNGDFETGDFSGWTVGATMSSPYQSVFSGSYSDVAMNDAGTNRAWALRNTASGGANPITNFGAFNGFDGSPGYFYLQQAFSLAGSSSTGVLEFDWGINSSYGGQNRVFTVNILDASETQVANVFTHVRATGSTPWNLNQELIVLDPFLAGLSAGTYFLQFKMDIPENYTGPAAMSLDNIAMSVSSVPEPSTYALMALGLVGLGVYRRKRK